LPVQSAIGCAVTTISRTITVAAGVFAPGHLGELTRVVPFELADALLEETRTRELVPDHGDRWVPDLIAVAEGRIGKPGTKLHRRE
jgi:hypothetical protein